MANPITDYPSLQAAFEDYTARPDLSEYLPYFTQEAETRFNRKLRTREMQTGAGLLPATDGYSLPVDYLEWISAKWVDPANPSRPLYLRYVEPDSPEFRHRYRPNGSPQYFTVLDAQLETRSTKAGNLTLSYYRKIPALTAAAPSNWLIGVAPDLYLYGVIAESYRFQKDEARSGDWATMADDHLAALMGQGDSQKVSRRPTRAAEDAAEATARNTPG